MLESSSGAMPLPVSATEMRTRSPSLPVSFSTLMIMRPPPGIASRAFRTMLSNATSSRSEEHTSELQSLMRLSYAVFCLKKNTPPPSPPHTPPHQTLTHHPPHYHPTHDPP